MTTSQPYCLETFMENLQKRAPDEAEFHQAVREVFEDVVPVANETPHYLDCALLERMSEPERIVSFRVAWEADDGKVHVNRGYRVQFNGAIGPYKGGLRFHPSVNPSVLKFLAFEQTFKNALTGLPMGGGKGGSDFNPNGHSDREIRNFCNAFMMELHRHIGPNVDVPAGDINVGTREIGYMFGAYRRITNEFEGSITGKGITYGGSELRMEATGHGLLHFVCHMLETAHDSVSGRTFAISGAGNVATHAADKAIEMGGTVLTLSDSGGFLHMSDGFGHDLISEIRDLKADGGSLSELSDRSGLDWHEGKKPWNIKCDIALPCATQNELNLEDAEALAENGCRVIGEGANMPLTAQAISYVRDHGILFAPAKAANAGGVAVSGLEIAQNRTGLTRTRSDISETLHTIMREIHERCAEHGKRDDGKIDYAKGANVAAFRKVADAMVAQGIS